MRRWRWLVVAAGTAALLALPSAAQLLPAGSSPIGAATLLQRIQASGGVGYSGYAQAVGGLSLPVDTGPFAVNDLLGGTSQLRVWWRGSADWRVDTVEASGETDLHHDPAGTWTWTYEDSTAERLIAAGPALVRLPRSDDLVPGSLARRLLSEAAAADARRLPARRIAGESAAGLRLVVHDPRSSIRHIDVWALASSGLPLRVEVYGSTSTPIVSATMLDVTLTRPPAAATAFTPPVSARTEAGTVGDVVAALDQFGDSTPPLALAGLRRRTDLELGAVGVYGSGVTVLVAVPLPPRLADSVQAQIAQVPGVQNDADGTAVGTGPINLRLAADSGFGGRWLLVGTLTAAALRTAAGSLPPVSGFRFR
jgi:hypothetical protein